MYHPTLLRSLLAGPAWVLLLGLAAPAVAQQVVVGTPSTSVGSSFYENIGVGFGFSIGGAQPGPNGHFGNSATVGLTPVGQFTSDGSLQFQQGGGPPGLGGNPNAAGQLGFGIVGSGGGAFFNITGGQTSNRSLSSVTPSVTVMNGGTGGIYDVSQSSYVTGLVPVVGQWSGGGPVYTSPLAGRLERLSQGETGSETSYVSDSVTPPGPAERISQAVGGASTAAQGDLSVAEIRRQQAAAAETLSAEIADLLAEAEAAEAQGRPGVALIYYRQAARRAQGDTLAKLEAKIQELENQR